MSPCRVIFLVIVACAIQLLISGALFGWPSLAIVLRQEGLYLTKCNETAGGGGSLNTTAAVSGNVTASVLACQQVNINLIFSSTLLVRSILSILQGFLLDHWGPQLSIIVNAALCAIGCGLFGASRGGIDLYFPGFVIYGIGTSGLNTALMASAKQLHPQWKTYIVAVMSGFFDAAALTFYLYRITYAHTGLASTQFMTLYALLSVVVVVIVSVSWPKGSIAGAATTAPVNRPTDTKPVRATGPLTSLRAVWLDIWPHLRSRHFLWFILYNTPAMFWLNTFLGIMSPRFGVAQTDVSTIIIPVVGLTFSPIVAVTVHLFKRRYIPYVISLVLMLLWTLFVLVPAGGGASADRQDPHTTVTDVPSISLRYIAVILFSMFRCFHFTLSITYLADVFGYHRLGRLYSIAMAIPGILGIAQSALLYASLQVVGTFWLIDGLQAATVLLCAIPFTLHVFHHYRNDE